MTLPIYEYRCCGKTWESFHPVASRARERCRVCGEKPERLISTTVRVSGFSPYDEWNIDPNGPVRISSSAQLDRECDVRGLAVKGAGGTRASRQATADYHARVQQAVDKKRKTTL